MLSVRNMSGPWISLYFDSSFSCCCYFSSHVWCTWCSGGHISCRSELQNEKWHARAWKEENTAVSVAVMVAPRSSGFYWQLPWQLGVKVTQLCVCVEYCHDFRLGTSPTVKWHLCRVCSELLLGFQKLGKVHLLMYINSWDQEFIHYVSNLCVVLFGFFIWSVRSSTIVSGTLVSHVLPSQ